MTIGRESRQEIDRLFAVMKGVLAWAEADAELTPNDRASAAMSVLLVCGWQPVAEWDVYKTLAAVLDHEGTTDFDRQIAAEMARLLQEFEVRA